MSTLICDTLQGLTDPTIIMGPTPPLGDSSNRLATTAFVQTVATSGWTLNTTLNVLYPTSTGTKVAIGKTTATQALDVVGNGAFSGSLILGSPLAVGYGGTGLAGIGVANSILGVNNAGAALEYKALSSSIGTIAFTNGSGTLALDVVSNTSVQKVQGLANGTLINARHAFNFSPSFTVVDNPGSDRLDIGLAIGAGIITGAGATGQIAVFNGASSITSYTNLDWDNVNNFLALAGAINFTEQAAPAVSGALRALLYADSTAHKVFISENGSSFSAIVLESRQVNSGTGLTGGGDLTANRTLSVVPNTTIQKISFDHNGTFVSTRKELNLIEGSNVTITETDNPGSDRIDVTIAASITGGAYTTIENGGVALTQRNTLNFPGGALSAADNIPSNRTDVTLSTSPSLATTVVGTGRLISTGTGLSGGGDLSADRTLSVTPNTTNQQVKVDRNGTLIGTRKEINFIEGTNVTISAVDNSGSDRVDVTINSTGGGGGGSTSTNAVAFNGSSVVLTASSDNIIPFNSTKFDTASFHNNVTNNSRLTAPSTGTYMVTFNALVTTGTATMANIYVRLNGSVGIFFGNMNMQEDNPSGDVSVSMCGIDTLSSGDFVEIDIVPNGTATLVNGYFGIVKLA